MSRYSKKDSGQVLLFSLVVMVGLLVAAIILFDLHNAIRGKIKVETAQQAAALAGAKWQNEGLNLIGQLNLAKAAETISYVKELQEAETSREKRAIRRAYYQRMGGLTELQSRTSFIVPLLGVLAAQQAAKQNGMPNNSNVLDIYLSRDLEKHDYRYDVIHGYDWYSPYYRLIQAIASMGVAVRVNASISSLPEVWSNDIGFTTTSGLNKVLISDSSLYTALANNNFCYWQLKALAKAGGTINSTWLDNIDYIKAEFVKESEILTLGVSSGGVSSLSETGMFNDYQLSEDCTYFIYDDSWYPSSYTTESYEAHAEYWQKGGWLRNDRKAGYLYEGPVCAVDNYVDMPRFNRRQIDKPQGELNVAGNNSSLFSGTTSTTSTRIGLSISDSSEVMGVVAKPLGSFNQAENESDWPLATEVILPVFNKVALIPSTLPYNIGMLTEGDDTLKAFLQWLGEGNNLDSADPPSGSDTYIEALRKLEDPEYLVTYYNTKFGGLEELSSILLFGDSYKYPNDSAGAGWLQQAWLGYTSTSPTVMVDDLDKPIGTDSEGNTTYEQKEIAYVADNVVTTLTEEDSDGCIRTYYGNSSSGYYYYLTKDGSILTNENISCDGALTSSCSCSSGGVSAGSNSGPTRL